MVEQQTTASSDQLPARTIADFSKEGGAGLVDTFPIFKVFLFIIILCILHLKFNSSLEKLSSKNLCKFL